MNKHPTQYLIESADGCTRRPISWWLAEQLLDAKLVFQVVAAGVLVVIRVRPGAMTA